MRLIDCVQGTPEWKAARCGHITASRIVDVMSYKQPSSEQAKEAGFKLVRDAVAAGLRGEESNDRKNYRTELVAERLTGVVDDSAFQTKWLRDGRENEPVARTAYELVSGIFVDTVGFALHAALDCSGASPDGLVHYDGCLEIKCPKSTTHIEWIEAGVAPEEHMPQMQWEMACCERLWCDFVSFDPRMPEELQMFVVRVPRDNAMIAGIHKEVMKFEGEIQAQIARLSGRTRLFGSSVSANHDGVSIAENVERFRGSADEGAS